MSVAYLNRWQSVIDAVVDQIAADKGMRVLGICGAQGSGKSTLSALLATQLADRGFDPVVVSLDDFYLTRVERVELADTVHPLCLTRGVPGTHDVALLTQALAAAHAKAGRFTLPRFSKAMDDRERMETVAGDCLILEGWCVGVAAQPEADLKAPVNALESEEDAQGRWRNWVNTRIAQDYEPLWSQVDRWVFLRVPDFAQVYRWRAQQEEAIAAAQRMSQAHLQRFVQHYERLTRWQLNQPFPHTPGITVELDANHRVTQITPL